MFVSPCLSPVGFGSERSNFPLVLRGGMCGLVGVFCESGAFSFLYVAAHLEALHPNIEILFLQDSIRHLFFRICRFPSTSKVARAQSGLCLLLGERALASSRLQV